MPITAPLDPRVVKLIATKVAKSMASAILKSERGIAKANMRGFHVHGLDGDQIIAEFDALTRRLERAGSFKSLKRRAHA